MSQGKGTGDSMRVDTDVIRALADLLTEKDLSEIEVEDGDRKVVVRRNTTAAAMAQVFAHQAPGKSGAAGAAPPAAIPSSAPTPAEDPGSHPGVIKSPMVGTVYLAGEPGGTPFVSTGSRVKEGETLLIVEAMKVMNPIPAPRAGVVKQVLVQDAQPVEYDQPLVIVE